MNLPSVINAALPSVVAIGRRLEITAADTPPNFPFIIGTGFVVDENGLIATNRHVIEELHKWPKKSRFVAFFHHAPLPNGGMFVGVSFREIVGMFELGSFTYETRYFGDSNPDLAFAVVNVRGLPAMQINHRDYGLQIGTEIISIGFPQGRAPLSPHGGEVPSQFHPFVRRGIISSVLPCPCAQPHGFTVDVLSEGGASGSPICSSENGEVLGILYAGFPGAPITLGVPAQILHGSVQNVREQWNPNQSFPLLSDVFEDDIAKARENPTESPLRWEHLGRMKVKEAD